MRDETQKETTNTEPMSQVLKGISAEDLGGFLGWSTRFRIGPDDPMWGAVLATKISYQAAAVSLQAATDLSAQVAKIPEVIYRGAKRAANEVTASIAGQSDAFVSRLEAGGSKFARNFYAEVEPLLDQSMKKGGETLGKALQSGSLKLEKAEQALASQPRERPFSATSKVQSRRRWPPSPTRRGKPPRRLCGQISPGRTQLPER